MKKKILSLSIIAATFLAACGDKKSEEKKDDEKSNEDTEQVDEPVEAVAYDKFDKEKLQGNWKAIDAVGYSKDKIIGETYSFVGDTATFFKNVGDVGMVSGYYEIDGEKLSIKYSKPAEDPTMGKVTIYFDFTGGFSEDGKKLQLNASDMQITLEKQ